MLKFGFTKKFMKDAKEDHDESISTIKKNIWDLARANEDPATVKRINDAFAQIDRVTQKYMKVCQGYSQSVDDLWGEFADPKYTVEFNKI